MEKVSEYLAEMGLSHKSIKSKTNDSFSIQICLDLHFLKLSA